MNCLFCKIVNGEILSEKIYEDEAAFAFLDIHPLSPGHTVLVPKVHAENILDLPEAAVGPLFLAVKKVTATLNLALKPHGFTIGINHGKVSGQAIDHLHIHLIPRFEGDGGGSIHSVVKNPPQESVVAIKEKIIKFI
ncbi:MAG TPA: HIT family protein [Candidatus Paceibacterota bacterium]|nr:HIT family protein [Candidatus Paceibacterota bacterium]